MHTASGETRRKIIKTFDTKCRAIMTVILVSSLIPRATLAADVQWTLERDTTIVNTDVGAERWTITYRVADGRVVGNVHHTDGSPPSFVQCNRTEILGNEETFECFGADACTAAPCDDAYVALDSVTVATSLFLPPGTEVPPSEAVRALQALVGTWQFEVAGPEPFTREFLLGSRIRQPDFLPVPTLSLEGTGNVTRVIEPPPSAETEFLLTEIAEGFHFYFFDVVGEDRVEGVYRFATSLDAPPTDPGAPFTGSRIAE